MARIIREGRLQPQSGSGGITRITVGGFKSIVQEQSIEIKPLTILAGANSSGKSSMMQPLLLLKQTLSSDFDPGVLLLNGPNVKFTEVDQLLSHSNENKPLDTFHTGIEIGSEEMLVIYFTRSRNKGFDVEQVIYYSNKERYRIHKNMSQEDILATLSTDASILRESIADSKIELFSNANKLIPSFAITQNRFLFNLSMKLGSDINLEMMPRGLSTANSIPRVVHLPGLRGSRERDYPVTATGPTFPGVFEIYAASIIEQWQLDNEKEKLARLFSDLARLALTNKVIARRRNAAAIELLVNRFVRGDKEDMVSIADVGIGVSQALPVVVALHTANPGQLVYIEQPEIHLHPRAQYALAEVLADATKEGKRLVIETHSSILLLGIQTLVAEGKLSPELVKLHWFTQQEDGSTKIDSADLDEAGAFGNWPEDFHTVTLQSENRYIDAAEARLMGE